MVIGWGVDRSTSAVIVILFMCLEKAWSETVYMDRYGDCFHGGPMEVEDESYKIMAQGGDAYDTLTCEMTFKSIKKDRLCLSFTSFWITRCDVKLSVYSEKSASGNAMGTYTCHTLNTPDMVCSDGKYLTVRMKKQELSHDGYNFVLMLREYSQTDAFASGIDAYIVSISMIVGIIVAVIVLVILTAVVIVCCCCKNRQFNMPYRQKSSASSRTAYTDVPVQPSAPPLPVDEPPAYSEHPPPYSSSDITHSAEPHSIQQKGSATPNQDYVDVETQKLQDSIQQFDEQNKAVLQTIQKIEAAKKDKDAKVSLEALEGQLQTALQNVKQLEKEIQEAQTEVNQKLGHRSSGPGDRRKPLEPDDQEMAYELKSQLLKNVEIQNQKLKTEFTLHEKMTESRMLSQQNKRLHEDVTLSRANSMRLIKVFERKAKEADSKLKEMTQELHRSQDLAEKYRNLYELERRKNVKEGEHLPPVDETARLPDKESSYTFLGGGTRINDIIRKNEVLVEENTDLKREVRRLKEDNHRLVRQTKLAMQDRDQILHKLETSEANRRNLMKRLEKEKDQHQTLSKSLTRQASDWILLKKQIAQFDEEYRWSQVGRVNPQTAEERSRLHPVTKNVYMPRKMFPVEQYDKSAAPT